MDGVTVERQVYIISKGTCGSSSMEVHHFKPYSAIDLKEAFSR
jgi:hypothetical protein